MSTFLRMPIVRDRIERFFGLARVPLPRAVLSFGSGLLKQYKGSRGLLGRVSIQRDNVKLISAMMWRSGDFVRSGFKFIKNRAKLVLLVTHHFVYPKCTG